MKNSVDLCNNSLRIAVDNENLEQVTRLITTVDPYKVTKSLFNDSTSIVYEDVDHEGKLLILRKAKAKFTYEEVEGLVDKLSAIIPIKELGNGALQAAGGVLSCKKKIFLPRGAPLYCIGIDLDFFYLRFLFVNAEEEKNGAFNALRLGFAHDDIISVNCDDKRVMVHGYAGRIDEFIEVIIDFLVKSGIAHESERHSLFCSLLHLIVCDIATREMEFMDNIISQGGENHIMNLYSSTIMLMVDIFRELSLTGDVLSLDKAQKEQLKNGFRGEGIFEICPPVLHRSFERLAARLPKAICDSLRAD